MRKSVIAIIIIVLVVLYMSVFVVKEGERGITLRFGKVLRDDDKPESVSKRLKVYHEQTQPLIDYYTEQGVLKTVDGTRSLDEVFQAIVEILGE